MSDYLYVELKREAPLSVGQLHLQKGLTELKKSDWEELKKNEAVSKMIEAGELCESEKKSEKKLPEAPKAEEKKEEPKKAEPKKEEPKKEEPKKEEPKAEEPKN